MYIVSVIIEHPIRHLDMSFSYLTDKKMPVGIRVHVPFGHQKVVGFVQKTAWTDLTQAQLEQRDGLKYRFVIDMIDEQPILTTELQLLAQSLAKMTFSPLVSCLKTMLPPALKPSSTAEMSKRKEKIIYFQSFPKALTPKQQAYLEQLSDIKRQPLKEAPVSRSVLQALEAKGAILIEAEEKYREVMPLRPLFAQPPSLNQEQKQVLKHLFEFDADRPFLLYGITGSGKTEVYLQATQKVIAMNKQVLMLVPEISLTPKMVALFQARFQNQVAILHSRLSDGQRYDEYRRILGQEVKIVVGARSAVFAPLKHIGLIIMDEEHDASYKQNNTPRYHTRDIALWRAKYHHARLLLGSASPSIESYAKAQKGLYHLLKMKSRATAVPLATCQIVDMSMEARKGNLSLFSEAFTAGLNHCLEQQKQALILVNRRGYATYLLCRDCGYVPRCPHCDVSLTYHKKENVLRCHYCGYEEPYQHACPECGSQLVGYRGAGTEQMEEALTQAFPLAKIIRFDMDTTRKKNAHEKLLNAFEDHAGNILLGTQMIAKGLDFKDVTFVGVLDGDSALNLPDYRSAERTFQLLLQVAGRAGRHDGQAEVIIQTYNPHHYAIACGARQDYESFYDQEIALRRLAGYPPFCYLASILFSGEDNAKTAALAAAFQRFFAERLADVAVLGPAPAVISKIKNQYRYRILLKYKQSQQLFAVIQDALDHYHGKIKIEVDINPYMQL